MISLDRAVVMDYEIRIDRVNKKWRKVVRWQGHAKMDGARGEEGMVVN